MYNCESNDGGECLRLLIGEMGVSTGKVVLVVLIVGDAYGC